MDHVKRSSGPEHKSRCRVNKQTTRRQPPARQTTVARAEERHGGHQDFLSIDLALGLALGDRFRRGKREPIPRWYGLLQLQPRQNKPQQRPQETHQTEFQTATVTKILRPKNLVVLPLDVLGYSSTVVENRERCMAITQSAQPVGVVSVVVPHMYIL